MVESALSSCAAGKSGFYGLHPFNFVGLSFYEIRQSAEIHKIKGRMGEKNKEAMTIKHVLSTWSIYHQSLGQNCKIKR